MATADLRVGIDANILISAALQPRWQFEVVRAGLERKFTLLLARQVLIETRRNLTATHWHSISERLSSGHYETLPLPRRRRSVVPLVRDSDDEPLAQALLDARAAILVSLDRDFTDRRSTPSLFSERVQAMLPAVFLKDHLGWSSADLERIRHRTWAEFERAQ